MDFVKIQQLFLMVFFGELTQGTSGYMRVPGVFVMFFNFVVFCLLGTTLETDKKNMVWRTLKEGCFADRFLGNSPKRSGHWMPLVHPCEDVAYAYNCTQLLCLFLSSLCQSWNSWWFLIFWFLFLVIVAVVVTHILSKLLGMRISDQFEIYSASWLGCWVMLSPFHRPFSNITYHILY